MHKTGNNWESLLTEIRQIVYSLYHSKDIDTMKLHSAELHSIKLHPDIKMNDLLMNSENSQTSELYILILKLTDKLDLRRDEKIISLSNLSIFTQGKI